MIFPWAVGIAANIGHVCGGGNKARGTGGPRIGTIGVLLLAYPWLVPLLDLDIFRPLTTPSFDNLLVELVLPSKFLP